MKVSHHITLLSVVCFIGIMQSTNIYAQETTTREERIKLLQLLQSKYDQEELSQIPSASKNTDKGGSSNFSRFAGVFFEAEGI